MSYDRLTQLDNAFLAFEDETAHMHVASIQIQEAAPLRLPDGSVDIDRIQDYVSSRLHLIPRYRQRLAWTPIEGHPVWIDDPSFNIRYHVRHTRIPQPGGERQLKRMVGRIFSQQLDRNKPLWEMYVIEGLENGDQLAVLSKVHHCMIDGVAGSELLAALLTSEPKHEPDPPVEWIPRPTPGALELGAGEVTRAINAPIELGRGLLRLAQDKDDARHELAERVGAIGRMLADAVNGPSPAPFNQPIGAYRRVDWMTMPLSRIREVRKAVGGTVNDVVLTTAAGAIGRFLSQSRGVDINSMRFRVMAPVSMRSPDQLGKPGNHVSAWMIDLPISEPDPLVRLKQISEKTRQLKESKQALGAELLTQVTEWTGSAVLSLGGRLMRRGAPFNMVVTNVPGPQMPLYLLESRLLDVHPMLPLLGTLGLGIALLTYDGTLSWGFAADWDLVPDLHDLVEATRTTFESLHQSALGSAS